MSADYRTKHLKGYECGEYVYVVWACEDDDDPWSSGESPLGSFDPEIVAELQEIMDARSPSSELLFLHLQLVRETEMVAVCTDSRFS